MESSELRGIPPGEGLREVDEIREAFGIDEDQNISYAELSIDGETDELIAVSGSDSPPGTMPLAEVPSFETRYVRWDRSSDAEVKLIEAIAVRLRQTPFRFAEIRLFTERPPCLSCRGVISQFRSEFPPPEVKLAVTHGNR